MTPLPHPLYIPVAVVVVVVTVLILLWLWLLLQGGSLQPQQVACMDACKGMREALTLVTVTFRKKHVQLGEALKEIFDALAEVMITHTSK